jgi:hypothetical protein
MAKTATDQQQAELARQHKADLERRRRVRKAALKKAGIPESQDKTLTDEQKARAESAAEKMAGLSGKALMTWILAGKNGSEQVADAQAAAARAAQDEKANRNVTRSKDPEASQLARDAAALAPEVKSAFLPKEGREFLTLFKIERDGPTIKVTREGAQGVEGALEVVEFDRQELRAFAVKGEKGESAKSIRASLSGLGKGTRLWGRKLGLMIRGVDQKA